MGGIPPTGSVLVLVEVAPISCTLGMFPFLSVVCPSALFLSPPAQDPALERFSIHLLPRRSIVPHGVLARSVPTYELV